MKHKLLFTFISVLLILQLGYSQDEKKNIVDADPGFLFGIDYGYNMGGGDLSDRFGNNLELGTKLSYILKNKNIHFGIKASYLFGDTVYQDVLENLRDENGFIIGVNGDYALVKLRQRGYELGAFFSKIFPLSSKNLRSGIRLDIGLNYFRHWIRLQDDYNTVAQFDDPYQTGYDRLTDGWGVNEFVGYHYQSNDRKLNFYGGFDFFQSFTNGRREYDFPSRSQLIGDRLDLMYGIKIGLILPIYIEASPDEIYY